MRILHYALLAFLCVGIAGACGDGRSSSVPRAFSPDGRPPNIVLILLDDADATSLAFMPKTRARLLERGTFFPNFFVSDSLCCPSRATILRGQYAHNHGVLTSGPPDGSFSEVYERGIEESTIVTWLEDAGYRTALFGKYFNRYPAGAGLTYIPPGWDEWHAVVGSGYRQVKYVLNENGTLRFFGSKKQDFGTDVLRRGAARFIRRASRSAQPFFLYVAPLAPHWPAASAPRDKHLFSNVRAPRTAAFNEEDVSDKPLFIRNLPPTGAELDELYGDRLRSLQAVDDLVANVVDALAQRRLLSKTVIVLTSDNGFMLGQHRIGGGKRVPYEESIRVGMVLRGPGVPEGAVRPHLVGNVDLAPTFAALAGIDPPEFVDGRSLLPLLRAAPPPPERWRQAYLLEYWPSSVDERSLLQVPRYSGIRTRDLAYIEYATGERELYDLRRDPDQLENLAEDVDEDVLMRLSRILAALKRCAGESCRQAEARAVPPLAE